MMKAVIRDKVFLFGATKAAMRAIKDEYEHHLFEEKSCASCEEKACRPSDVCQSCPAFLGVIKLWGERQIDGEQVYHVPNGHLNRVADIIDVDVEDMVDERKKPKMTHPLTFTGKLFGPGEVDSDGNPRPDQQRIVRQWMRKKYGVIKAPPRTGKTILAVNIACLLGTKTIVLVDQKEVALQFYAAFCGDEEKGRKAMTNVNRLRKATGKRIVAIAQKPEDFDDDLDVVIVNYQKFIFTYGAERLRKIVKQAGLLVVDEVHGANAHAFAKVVNAFWAKHKLGLSATPKRKDGRHLIVRDVMGPITAIGETTALKPRIEVFPTGLSKKGYQHKSWSGAMKWLNENEERQKIITRLVFKDLRQGHIIIIPVDSRAHQDDVVKRINKQASVNRQKRGEGWPKETAVAFHGNLRKDLRAQAVSSIDNGQALVLVAIRKMVRQAIDFKLPTMLYVVVPMSAKQGIGAPMFEQLSTRVCTPSTGKKQPVVRIFIDGIGPSQGCFKSLFRNEIMPKLKGKDASYLIDNENYKLAMTFLSARGDNGESNERIRW
jgi:hypothetical protein